MKLKHLAAVLGFGLTLGIAGQSGAVSLWSFEDDDIDFVLRDQDGDGFKDDPVISGDVQAGDVFLAVFEIPIFRVNGVDAIPSGMEITGVSAVELEGPLPTPGVGATYQFKPFADFNGLLTHLGYGGTLLPAGAAIAMWVNDASGANNLELNRTVSPATNCASLQDCVLKASDGKLLQVDGASDVTDFGAGDPDEFWLAVQAITSIPGDLIGTMLNTANDRLAVAVNFALTNLYHDPSAVGRSDWPVGYVDVGTGNFCGFGNGPVADGCVQFTGSATLNGGQGLSNGAVAHSDFDGQKYVPEPATLALFGIGLLGLGGRFRRSAVA